MNRSPLRFLAVLIGTVMAVVPFLGLDNLPREVRAQIANERSALTAAQNEVKVARTEVTGDLEAEPALFRAIPASAGWPAEFDRQGSALQAAGQDMAELDRLDKANRRGDRQRADQLLAHERSVRTGALAAVNAVETDARHWIDFKKNLPDEMRQMDRDYQAVHAFDLAPLTAVVQKAEIDWPQKKPDLDARLAGFKEYSAQAEKVWQSSAEARRAATAGDFAHLDFGALASAGDTLHTEAADLPHKSDEVKTLTAQLYTSWDKLLVDMRKQGGEREQKIRTVSTRYPDAAAKTGDTTSDERWIKVSDATYRAMQNDLGMAVEHKPEGLYDSEAEHVAQPAGFAYMAPPGQSNRYGYWEHSGGHDFWVFYGQYALLRDLLFNHSYRAPERYDWDGYYESRRNGQTYYGREPGSSAPRYGTQGSTTEERYGGSTFGKSGGFKNSPYASKPGTFRSSPYAAQGGDNTPHRFGSGSKPAEPPRSFHSSPAPRPAPSFRPSAPRRFGKR